MCGLSDYIKDLLKLNKETKQLMSNPINNESICGFNHDQQKEYVKLVKRFKIAYTNLNNKVDMLDILDQ